MLGIIHMDYQLSITNCSNNYGPWQFPEKLIPLIILKGMEGKKYHCMVMVET